MTNRDRRWIIASRPVSAMDAFTLFLMITSVHLTDISQPLMQMSD